MRSSFMDFALKWPCIPFTVKEGLPLPSCSVIALQHVVNADCTYSAGSDSQVDADSTTVTCKLNEQETTGATVCDFYAEGQATITLKKYSDPDISQFITLTTTSEVGRTKATLELLNSVDDLADTITYIMGSLTCTSTAITNLQEDPIISMINEVSATSWFLTITFNLVNDHIPEFSEAAYVVDHLPETFPNDLDVLSANDISINATDGDTLNTADSIIVFTLQDDFDGSFSVETLHPDKTVALYSMRLNVLKVLDYNTYNSYTLTVIATDSGSSPLSSVVSLTLNIDDEDNLDPKFESTFYTSNVPQLSVGDQILTMDPAQILAEDQDSGRLTAVQYALVFNNDGSECSEQCQAMTNAFSIDPTSGVITMDTNAEDLDTITSRVASFAVTATQVDDTRHSTNAFVSVSLPPSSTSPTTTAGTSVNPCTTLSPIPCPPCPTVDTTTILVTTECPTPPPCPTVVTTPTTACPTPSPCPTVVTEPITACPTPPPCPTVTTVVTEPTTCPTPPPCPTVTTVVTEPTTCPTPPPCPTVTTIVTEPTTCPPPTPCPTGDTTTVASSTQCPTPPPCPTDTTIVTGSSDHTGSTTDCVCPTAGSGPTNSAITDCTTAATETPRTPPTTTPGTTTTTVPKTTYAPTPANNLIITVKNVSAFTEVGTVLVQMHEVEGNDGDYQYSLESNTGDTSEYFGIDSFTGDVFVKDLLHYSSTPYRLTVFADGPTGRDNASLNIEVVNSAGVPVFDVIAQQYSITEGESGGFICSLNSYYEDNNYQRQYWIYSVVPNINVFEVDSSTGDLTFTGPLDYETSPTYDVTITVSTSGARSVRNLDLGDESTSLEYNQALVHINVVDINDIAPEFVVYGIDGDSFAVGISSYTTSGQDVVQLSATDADTADDNTQVVFEMSYEYFYINKDTGLIRASTSLENLEFASTVHSSYTFEVTAHNIADVDVSSSLSVEVYILSGDDILMLNTTYTPEDFDANCNDILSTLKEETGADVRVLEYEDNESASAPFKRYRSTVGDDGDVVTTVYLYALDSSGPLGKEDLLNLLEDDSDAFAEAGFIVSSAAIYSDVGPLVTVDDNTTYIIIMSCLGAVAAVFLIGIAILSWKYVQERKKVKGTSSSHNDKDYSSLNDESIENKMGNGKHAVQVVSPGWSRTSVQLSQEEQLRTDNATAELVPEFHSGQLHNEYPEYEKRPELDTNEMINTETATKVEGGNELEVDFGLIVEDNLVDVEDNLVDVEDNLVDVGDNLVDVKETFPSHQEPDPDYLQSILIDPNAPKYDDDSKSTKSGVTFSETAEVISVVQMDDDFDEQNMAQL